MPARLTPEERERRLRERRKRESRQNNAVVKGVNPHGGERWSGLEVGESSYNMGEGALRLNGGMGDGCRRIPAAKGFL